MKTYVLMLAEKFPAKHYNAGQPTCFLNKLKAGEKIHTIRANYAFWEKRFKKIDAGEACISIRQWEGQPYRSKEVEVLRLDKSHGIGLEKIEFVGDLSYILVNNHAFSQFKTLAKNDGLSASAFHEWFKTHSESEPLAIIHFTKFRYGTGAVK